MYRTLQEAYECVNWQKIHAYMVLTNWTWANCGGTPAISDMQATVQRLMHNVETSGLDNTLSGTGGFTVYKFTWASGVEYEIVFDIAFR